MPYSVTRPTMAAKRRPADLGHFAVRVLSVVARYDCPEAIWWRVDGEYAPITFFAMCSDIFAWARADCEPVTADNLDAFERAFADVDKITSGDPTFAAPLFCARMRGERPQGGAYPSDERLWPLFDACGPVREVDMFNNPHAAPSGEDLWYPMHSHEGIGRHTHHRAFSSHGEHDGLILWSRSDVLAGATKDTDAQNRE